MFTQQRRHQLAVIIVLVCAIALVVPVYKLGIYVGATSVDDSGRSQAAAGAAAAAVPPRPAAAAVAVVAAAAPPRPPPARRWVPWGAAA